MIPAISITALTSGLVSPPVDAKFKKKIRDLKCRKVAREFPSLHSFYLAGMYYREKFGIGWIVGVCVGVINMGDFACYAVFPEYG